VALLALIAGTVSYLHMHLLVELHGQPGSVAALTPLTVDGMIVAASWHLRARPSAGTIGQMVSAQPHDPAAGEALISEVKDIATTMPVRVPRRWRTPASCAGRA
jgi:hypothetical protein